MFIFGIYFYFYVDLPDGYEAVAHTDMVNQLILYNTNGMTVNYNGAEINSANVGINTTTSSGTKTVNINSGTISGDNYGIYADKELNLYVHPVAGSSTVEIG